MNIGVFFGSRSPEHDVSIITGELIISELKKLGHNVVPVYLNKKGEWFLNENLGSLSFFLNKAKGIEKFGSYYLDLEKSIEKMVFKQKVFFGKNFEIDLAFPAFHGANGEDGSIQGMFEMFNIPYVGCNVASSSISMDKILTKLIYQSRNIPTVDFVNFTKFEWRKNKENILNDVSKLQFPVFVKAARLGSSIGITKVNSYDDLDNAIEISLRYDDRILTEQGVDNLMDITCAVIGNDEPVASLIQESIIEGEMFSYEEKYIDNGGTQTGEAKDKIIIPARLDERISNEIREIAVKVYKLIDCSGMARIDFLYNKESKKYYVNEINTIPGNLYAHLWKASGINFDELLKKLIDLALERHKDKNNLINKFDSNLLKFANSVKLNHKNQS